jgi:cell fate (sporulation/competence/biofilm development) regulator YlbF (YheA/YmcA/DUF963 family)
MIQSATTTPTITDDVRIPARAFAEALADMPEFHAFEDAAVVFKHDRAAQEAVRQFEEKQRALQMIQQLGVLEQAELNELDRLRHAMVNQPRVRAYVDAQNDLILLCQAAAKELSAAIELDFAGACASECCG